MLSVLNHSFAGKNTFNFLSNMSDIKDSNYTPPMKKKIFGEKVLLFFFSTKGRKLSIKTESDRS